MHDYVACCIVECFKCILPWPQIVLAVHYHIVSDLDSDNIVLCLLT